ncbi:DMT family transporter [Streptomyces candidus]|uniref:Drug/metabolite transporter (DMT)-like permease n=1 Tax=Streptomyces candidus TaxID=67283 RepID=A0A7X0LU43_9ACTN|nr:DMT family transporter [Streptomyces candidus]MBB6439696.1 drug/metabolite transporter (DMT)-like permease [Streptomyces candidus]GHH56668.1 transporter [Streptomyces candidus]
MRPSDWSRLVVLSALWGASFIFLRVLAPVLGATTTAGLRVGVGGLAFLPYFAAIRFAPRWREHWVQYLVVGLFNVATPMLLFSFAAVHIPASYSVVINSSTPLFGTLLAAVFLGQRLTVRGIAGLTLSMIGVALVAGGGSTDQDSRLFWWSIGACLAAAVSYSLSGIYVKRFASHVDPIGTAGCSQLLAGVLLVPFWVTDIPPVDVTPTIILNVLALAVLCTTIGFLLYFRLIADVGPSRAMTVGLLTPAFGVLWGALFLGERLTPIQGGGCALIVVSVAMVLLRSSESTAPKLQVRTHLRH